MRAKIIRTIAYGPQDGPPLEQNELGVPIRQGTIDIKGADEPRPFYYVELGSLDCLLEMLRTAETDLIISERVRHDHDPSIDLTLTIFPE